MAIMRSELAAIYEALRGGHQPPELPPLPIQYADFAAWQRARLDGGELGAQARQQQCRLVGSGLTYTVCGGQWHFCGLLMKIIPCCSR